MAATRPAPLVNGVLLSATVATQLFVPRLLRRFGTTPVLVTSLVLMGVAAPGYALSDAFAPVLAWSAVRGVGFGIVTVLGSTIVTHLVPRERRGEAIGVYGLAVAAPMVLLMPASVAVAEEWGYGWAFAVATPLLGVPWAVTLGRLVDRTPSASITGAAAEPRPRRPSTRSAGCSARRSSSSWSRWARRRRWDDLRACSWGSTDCGPPPPCLVVGLSSALARVGA